MNDDKFTSTNCPLKTAQQRTAEAAQGGFDWDDVGGPLAKIEEELRELEDEIFVDEPCQQRLFEELGDILFSVVNVARHLDVDAAAALEATVAKFNRRLQKVDDWVEADSRLSSRPSIQELEKLWQRAKDEE